MDKQPNEGHNSSTEGNRDREGETLDLRLTLEQASSLVIILSRYNGYLIIENLKKLEVSKERDELIAVEQMISEDANYIYRETGKILVELEKPKPTIIRPPSWRE